MNEIRNLIAGELCSASTGATLDVFEPATGRKYAQAPDSTIDDVNVAVAAAMSASDAWAATPVEARSKFMHGVADLIERDLEAFARAESIDTGKPIHLARTIDIPRAVANFRFFADAIRFTSSEAHQTDGRALNVTLRRPVGVVGLISPWNLPLYLLSWKIAPAIATGNTAVAKPSEVTPMTAFMLSERCIEAGLPPGVVNIVHGRGGGAGAALVGHDKIKAISFTGGTATGSAIAAEAAPKFKKLSLELGGKNPTIIFDDADLERIMPDIVRASFANQGEICLCGSRILVQRGVQEAFTELFVRAVRAIPTGDPLDDAVRFGAVVSSEHASKIESYIELAGREGGRILTGGGRMTPSGDRCRGGWFIEPTVIDGLDPACRVQQEEIFGPVVTVTPFEDEREAIRIANGTRYGLSASVWTRDLGRAQRTARALEAGTVWVNCWLLRDLRVPFGGVKASGVGREGGDEALRFFTEPTNVCLRLDDEEVAR